MGRAPLSIKKKLEILSHYHRTGNVRATARFFSNSSRQIQPAQIRKWKRSEQALRDKYEKNTTALTVHKGRPIEREDVESAVYEWIIKQRDAEVAVTTGNVIAKARSIDANFKNGDDSRLWRWVYPFLERWQLSLRVATRKGQKLSGHLMTVRTTFVEKVMEQFGTGGSLCTVPPQLFVNMDETAVFFESKPNATIHHTGANTVSIRCSGSSNKRMTVCVAVASNGCKLPLFVIFKGEPNGRIERSLPQILPRGIYGCCQAKGWMDERGLRLWTEQVWKPYVRECPKSALLLDDFVCHKQPNFIERMKQMGTHVEIIPGGYTCVLQPCDVGVMRPFKSGIRKEYGKWASYMYSNLSAADKLPVPERSDVLKWIDESWSTVSAESIVDTFKHIGLTHSDSNATWTSEVEESSGQMGAAVDSDYDVVES